MKQKEKRGTRQANCAQILWQSRSLHHFVQELLTVKTFSRSSAHKTQRVKICLDGGLKSADDVENLAAGYFETNSTTQAQSTHFVENNSTTLFIYRLDFWQSESIANRIHCSRVHPWQFWTKWFLYCGLSCQCWQQVPLVWHSISLSTFLFRITQKIRGTAFVLSWYYTFWFCVSPSTRADFWWLFLNKSHGQIAREQQISRPGWLSNFVLKHHTSNNRPQQHQ